jgi:hypothetical protein
MEAQAAPAAALLPATKRRAFHQLSSEFFAVETHVEYIAELSLFVLIAAIAAWPIMSMLACLAWMKIAI